MTALAKLATLTAISGRIWRLTTPYFRSEEKWKARALFVGIVVLNLAAVYLLVQINEWNRVFYDALDKRDQPVFWSQLLRFTYLAFAYIVVAVYKFYLTQLLDMRWRAWLTAHYLQRWLGDQAFYRIELARFSREGAPPDNPDQRIQEDLKMFTAYSISLSMGLLNAVVTLASFVGILWGLSGGFGFNVGGSHYEIAGFMVWAAIAYCLAGSVITHYIGRIQIPLNFEQQKLEANFRHHMVRVREYSEAIALDKGEPVERGQLDLRFSHVLANYLALIRAQKNLAWFNNFFGQAAVVFPYVVAAPRFFAGAIQLGELMQISSAFNRVQESLSWFLDNYSDFATWRATADRLTTFEETLARESERPVTAVETGGDSLQADDLAIALPTGAPLLEHVSLRAQPGDAVLLQGPSGSGKSTLLRSLSGIWPYARGHVKLPADTMCIPQNPYFPEGSLRAALSYPEPAERYGDEQLKQALADALLPQLAQRLDDHDAWSLKLSGGERQRLAVARVLLKQPRWVLADEATSALDPETARGVYQALVSSVRKAGGAMVSIAHGDVLEPFHNRRWTLRKQEAGAPYRVFESPPSR